MPKDIEKLIQKHHNVLDLRQSQNDIRGLNPRLFDNLAFYTVADIASMTGYSTRTIERRIKSEELRATQTVGKKWLISRENFESWLKPKEV